MIALAGLAALVFFGIKNFGPMSPENAAVAASQVVASIYQAGRARWESVIHEINLKLGGGQELVEGALWRAIVKKESDWTPWALRFEYQQGTSTVPRPDWTFRGASLGLFQTLWPALTDSYAEKAGVPKGDVGKIFLPENNARIALLYLAHICEVYSDTADRIDAYNSGIKGVSNQHATGKDPNPYYVKKAYQFYLEFGGQRFSSKVPA